MALDKAMGPSGTAFVDGRFMPVSQATVPLLDWGFLRSDACQDTVSVWRGNFFCLNAHIERFFQSCRNLKLDCPYDKQELGSVLARLVLHSGFDDAYVQMIATRGLPRPNSRDLRTCKNTFLAFCLPYMHITPESGKGHLDAIVSHRPRISAQSVPSSIKNYHWIDFELGLLEAYERGGNTVLLTDGDGGIAEGPGFNVFGVRANRIFTPESNVLRGITRDIVIELAEELGLPVERRRVLVRELQDADEVFATSTAGGVMPIRSIDGHQFQPGEASTSRALADLYWKKRNMGWRSVAVKSIVRETESIPTNP